ncbi:DUF7127 family protein [Natronobacterium texcoconense]|uniref:Hsp20/alpha crystallin family protein n=1 Tax=Natronobacterium texcoconense TaxID=1095778 RepID=A0A1H1HPY0_NATTX|nr:hypothetical protein [Natronobacterium texcoconense]SDR27419.1 hypothetical protein SAMN04489842_2941 [Natronobacterium texcoconense]
METPPELEDAAGDRTDITVTNREYDEEQVIAVDFGRDVGEISLDVVDETAIVVAGDDQFEFDIPGDATDVTANDGILTIRKEQ